MAERLGFNPEGRLWKGPDVVTSSPVLLEKLRRAIIPVIITPDSLPPSSRNFRELQISTRSRLAQVGLEVHGVIEDEITEGVSDFRANVEVTNHCQRPIKLEEGFSVFRFFHESPGAAIDRRALESIFAAGIIKIEGEEGVDWEWSRNGIFVSINSEGRKWIPPDSNNTPIIIDGKVVDYRSSIAPLFVPISQTDEKILWIGETPKITMPDSIEMILSKSAFHNHKDIQPDNVGVQINARLIDGSKTGWRIRTEVESSTNPKKIPNVIHMRFARNGQH